MASTKKTKKTNDVEPIFEELPDPNGEKVTVYPLEDLFVGSIKEKDQISEYTILYKKTDDNGNTTYQDLISREIYTEQSLKQNNISIPERTTLLTLINEIGCRFTSELKKKMEVCKNKGYTTTDIIVMINSQLNSDLYYYDHWGKPFFCKEIEDGECVFDKDDDVLTKLLITLTTSKKIPILNGDTGIGKTTYANKMYYFKRQQSSYFTKYNIYHGNYNEGFKQRLSTIKQRKDRIANLIRTLRKDVLIFIDEVDFSDKLFLKELAENIDALKCKIVLIPKTKITKENIDSNYFALINVPKQKEEIQRTIIDNTIKELETNTTLSLNINKEDKQELISILLTSDQTNSLNNTFDNNPNLAKVIITNAFKLATAFQQDNVTLYNFIDALGLENVNIAPDSKDKTTKDLNSLIEKIEEREKQRKQEAEEKRQQQELAKTKTFGYRLRAVFNKK